MRLLQFEHANNVNNVNKVNIVNHVKNVHNVNIVTVVQSSEVKELALVKSAERMKRKRLRIKGTTMRGLFEILPETNCTDFIIGILANTFV